MDANVTGAEFFQLGGLQEVTACERRRELHSDVTNSLFIEMQFTRKQDLAWTLSIDRGLTDEVAAERMKIRRPAFNRLINRARQVEAQMQDCLRQLAVDPALAIKILRYRGNRVPKTPNPA